MIIKEKSAPLKKRVPFVAILPQWYRFGTLFSLSECEPASQVQVNLGLYKNNLGPTVKDTGLLVINCHTTESAALVTI